MRTLASAREEEGAGVEEWEELLHPGPQEAFYPTLSHDATPIPHFPPPSDHGGTARRREAAWALGIRRWDAVRRHPSRRRTARCSTRGRNGDCGCDAIPSARCALGGRWWEAPRAA